MHTNGQMAEASVTLHRHLGVLDQRDKWEAIAHRLAHALLTVEENPTRLKSWHQAFDAVKAYEALNKEVNE